MKALVKRLEKLERAVTTGGLDLNISFDHSEAAARRADGLSAIDLKELETLCALHCSDGEIAAWFGVPTEKIEQERKSAEFAAVMERGRAKGKVAIRQGQMRAMEKGSSHMAVWLGRQILRQQDEVEDLDQPIPVIVLPSIPDEGEIPITANLEGDAQDTQAKTGKNDQVSGET